jgi:tRNA/tmRNA/rRNA uracil-C5-methylase (TrmA/RlmC/RlmD family)
MTVQAHVMPPWRDTPGLSPHLVFGSDVALRTRWFVPASFQHPAKLHLGLLHWLIEHYTLPDETIADPMAGSGGILYAASLQRHVIAREIEPRWIDLMQENAAHITTQAG